MYVTINQHQAPYLTVRKVDNAPSLGDIQLNITTDITVYISVADAYVLLSNLENVLSTICKHSTIESAPDGALECRACGAFVTYEQAANAWAAENGE